MRAIVKCQKITVFLFLLIINVFANNAIAQGNITDFHKILRDRIEKLSANDWNKADYMDIHSKINAYTPKLRGEEGVFRKHLENTYSKVLLRSCRAVMNGSCSPEHAKLGNMMREVDRIVKLVSDPSDLKQLQLSYKEHQEVLGFISSVRSGRVANVSVLSKYDMSYVTSVFEKQNAFEVKKKWTCVSIKNGLNNLPSYLNERHRDFLTRLVAAYQQENVFNQEYSNNVERRIQDYYSSLTGLGAYTKYQVSKSSAQQFCDDLIKKVVEHNNSRKNETH